jgi:hypothetical protein
MNPAVPPRWLLVTVLTGVVAATFGSGCIRASRLQYDYSRSYAESFATQTDLTRASVKDSLYAISGPEGMALRAAVVEETSSEKTGTAEAIE